MCTAGWHTQLYRALVSDSTCLKACANTVSVSSNNTTFQYNPDTVKLIDEYMLDLEEGSN